MSEAARSRRRDRGTRRKTSGFAISEKATSEPTSDLEMFSKQVLSSLIADSLPATPNNFSAYFDKLLEEQSTNFRKDISSILELEKDNDNESSIELEQSLKMGFVSVKNILNITANLYKNMSLMTKILNTRKKELNSNSSPEKASNIIIILEDDILKLNSIVKKQSDSMKTTYDDIATIVKSVENETIFDSVYGIYNKRYLMSKINRECELVKEFKHQSSLIIIELDKELREEVGSEKAILLMTKTIARLLLKTSRRSDTVAHYGHGTFAMLLKHTNIPNAQKTSERLCDLVSSSNFFIADNEIVLKISIGITEILADSSAENVILDGTNGMIEAYKDLKKDFSLSSKTKSTLPDSLK